MQTLKKTCCLGMVALCASVSFAAGELQTKATFEAPTAPHGVTSIHLNDDGKYEENLGYWTLNGDVHQEEITGDQATIKAYEDGAAPTAGGAQYLSLDLQDRLDRNINLRSTAGDATSPAADNIAEGEGSLYFDSLVQFTASDAESGVDLMEENDKLLVWLKEAKTAEDGTVTPAQLMVTAGYMSDANNNTIQKRDYAVTLPEGVTIAPDEWHRLTIQALKQLLPGETSYYQIAFRVLVDGKVVTCADAKGVDGALITQMAEDLFPAYVPMYGNNGYVNLTAATFKGMGGVDNISWSRESPIEIVNEVTFVLGDGVASVTVTPEGADSVTYTDASTTVQFTGKYEYVFNAKPGYCTPEVTTDGSTITAVAKIGVASIGETLYPSFAAACNSLTEGDATIKMLTDGEEQTGIYIDSINLTLDLNGKSLKINELTAASMTVVGEGTLAPAGESGTVYSADAFQVGTTGSAIATTLQINVQVMAGSLVMNTGALALQPQNTDGDPLAADAITVPAGYKFAEADGVWKLVTDGGEEPSITAGADAGNVNVDTSAKTITVSVSTGTELTVANATDYTISVPANVAKINGAVKSVVVKAGAFDITGAFTVATAEGVTTIALDKNGSVTIGEETVTVDPAVADVATGAAAAVTVKTIPGLTYTLLRATAVKGSTYAAVETTAVTVNATTTTLSDGSTDRPADAAFYKVQVTR